MIIISQHNFSNYASGGAGSQNTWGTFHSHFIKHPCSTQHCWPRLLSWTISLRVSSAHTLDFSAQTFSFSLRSWNWPILVLSSLKLQSYLALPLILMVLNIIFATYIPKFLYLSHASFMSSGFIHSNVNLLFPHILNWSLHFLTHHLYISPHVSIQYPPSPRKFLPSNSFSLFSHIKSVKQEGLQHLLPKCILNILL